MKQSLLFFKKIFILSKEGSMVPKSAITSSAEWVILSLHLEIPWYELLCLCHSSSVMPSGTGLFLSFSSATVSSYMGFVFSILPYSHKKLPASSWAENREEWPRAKESFYQWDFAIFTDETTSLGTSACISLLRLP